jgi:hypothetical protein
MTIPDLGHCAGSGTPPADGTGKKDGADQTAVCRVCSGRFELRSDGTMSLHDAAGIEERESSHRSADDPVAGPAHEA